MLDLQLATTLVAPTGTGLLYTAYKQDGNSAVWRNGAGVGRSVVSMSRVEPKPTSVFPGVERISFKRTIYLTVGTVEYGAIIEVSTSIPVPIALADRTAIFTHGALLARDSRLQAAIETGVIPT